MSNEHTASRHKILIDCLKEPSAIDVPWHVWRFIGGDGKQIDLAVIFTGCPVISPDQNEFCPIVCDCGSMSVS